MWRIGMQYYLHSGGGMSSWALPAVQLCYIMVVALSCSSAAIFYDSDSRGDISLGLSKAVTLKNTGGQGLKVAALAKQAHQNILHLESASRRESPKQVLPTISAWTC